MESVSLVAWMPQKAIGPMYIGRVIPEHVKTPGCLLIRVG